MPGSSRSFFRWLLIGAAVLSAAERADAAGMPCPTSQTPQSLPIALTPSQMLQALAPAPAATAPFDIVVVPGPALAAKPAALAAFERAAAQWERRISDPITVTINAD